MGRTPAKQKHYRDEKVIKALGAKVRELRASKGMSMEQLANAAEMEYKQLSRIERGEVNTSISRVAKLAEALGVDVKELFDF